MEGSVGWQTPTGAPRKWIGFQCKRFTHRLFPDAQEPQGTGLACILGGRNVCVVTVQSCLPSRDRLQKQLQSLDWRARIPGLLTTWLSSVSVFLGVLRKGECTGLHVCMCKWAHGERVCMYVCTQPQKKVCCMVRMGDWVRWSPWAAECPLCRTANNFRYEQFL